MARNRKEQGDSGATDTVQESRKWGIKVPLEKFLAEIASQDRSALCIYVYRLWPMIDRKLVDPKAPLNIEKIPCETLPDDIQDFLLKNHGSGHYQLRLYDANAGRKGGETLRCEINLNNHDFPPLTDPAEVQDRPENRAHIEYLKRIGKWRGEAVQQQTDSAAVAVMAEGLTRLASQAVQQEKGTKQKDDFDRIAQLAGVLKELKGTEPKAQADDLDRLVKLATVLQALQPKSDSAVLKDLMQQNTLLLTKLLERGSGGDAFDEIERVTQLAKALGLRPGGGGGGSWISELMQALPTVAAAGASLMAQARAAQPQAPAMSGAPQFPTVLPVEAQPAAESQENGVPEMNLAQMISVGRKALAAFKRGTPGDTFAEALCEFDEHGEAIYNELASQGPDTLLMLFKQTPFWAEFAGREADVIAWLKEFVAYGAESDAAEGAAQ